MTTERAFAFIFIMAMGIILSSVGIPALRVVLGMVFP